MTESHSSTPSMTVSALALTRAPLPQQLVADEVVEAVAPGFVGVAADIDAFDELHLPGLRILDIEVDVEDEVADLLHRAPCRPVGVDALGVVALAAVAVANLRTRGDLLLHLRLDRHDVEAAGGVELLPQEVVEQAQPALLVGRGRLERGVDEREAEEGAARHGLRMRGRGRRAARAGERPPQQGAAERRRAGRAATY